MGATHQKCKERSSLNFHPIDNNVVRHDPPKRSAGHDYANRFPKAEVKHGHVVVPNLRWDGRELSCKVRRVVRSVLCDERFDFVDSFRFPCGGIVKEEE